MIRSEHKANKTIVTWLDLLRGAASLSSSPCSLSPHQRNENGVCSLRATCVPNYHFTLPRNPFAKAHHFRKLLLNSETASERHFSSFCVCSCNARQLTCVRLSGTLSIKSTESCILCLYEIRRYKNFSYHGDRIKPLISQRSEWALGPACP